MKYFTFGELTRSETAKRLGIPNQATMQIKERLVHLVVTLLDPLREKWGLPITVTSGYRCHMLNRAVGGVRNSQHMQGLAADITVGTKITNRRLAQMIVDMNLPFDQLINERAWAWVHVSVAPEGSEPRRQILKTVKGGYAVMKYEEFAVSS